MYYQTEAETNAIKAYHDDPWSASDDEKEEHLAITEESVNKEGGDIELKDMSAESETQFEGGGSKNNPKKKQNAKKNGNSQGILALILSCGSKSNSD